MSDIKVYMIANLQIHDPKKYREYEKGFFPILKKHGGEFITFDDNIDHFEGDNPMTGRVYYLASHQQKKPKNGIQTLNINL